MDDDEEQMDLALNTNFDSELLDCWDDADTSSQRDDGESSSSLVVGATSRLPSREGTAVGWDHSAANLTRLPSFRMEQEQQQQQIYVRPPPQSLPAGDGVKQATGKADINSNAHLVLPAGNNLTEQSSKQSVTNVVQPHPGLLGPPQQVIPQQQQQAPPMSSQLHPLAIQSSANCPPHAAAAVAAAGAAGMNPVAIAAPAALQQQPTQQQPAAPPIPTINDLSAAGLLPLTISALAAGVPLPYPLVAMQQQQQQGASPAMGPATVLAAAPNAAAMNPPPQAMQPMPAQQLAPVGAPNQVTNTDNNSSNSGSSSNDNNSPPFLLFDAPVELRTNFENSQRAHGLPVLQDNNSYHFGIAVNGFHPQGLPGAQFHNVRLVDARHGDLGGKRIKNAKEQRRAQRIAELIDELRSKMEQGGWNVGLKSKFNTLSSCADYIQHMVKVNKEKEAAVEQAKDELEAKRRKLEEDKAQQDPSDPESTTSSLTLSSESATKVVSDEKDSLSVDKRQDKKRAATKPPDSEADGAKEGESSSSSASKAESSSKNKKPRLSSQESSSSSCSGADEAGGNKSQASPTGKNVSLHHQGTSSVSDITDSNKGSSSNTSGSDDSTLRRSSRRAATVKKASGDGGEGAQNPQPAAGSVSSDVAVAEDKGKAPQKASRQPSDVLLVRKRKSSKGELTSLDPDFVLDYEEVFVKSNVPQVLASTSGRIIAWNDFFMQVTGLNENEVERATIFSLVKSSKLSNLFEIVAAALKKPGDVCTSSSESPSSEEVANASEHDNPDEQEEGSDPNLSSSPSGAAETARTKRHQASKDPWDYSAMTLPCIKFRAKAPSPLYITVTLMSDDDPKKRCFHCVLTDCPGTNGALGPITPELLSMMFKDKSRAEAKTKSTQPKASSKHK